MAVRVESLEESSVFSAKSEVTASELLVSSVGSLP